jgi:hypothetical protein
MIMISDSIITINLTAMDICSILNGLKLVNGEELCRTLIRDTCKSGLAASSAKTTATARERAPQMSWEWKEGAYVKFEMIHTSVHQFHL